MQTSGLPGLRPVAPSLRSGNARPPHGGRWRATRTVTRATLGTCSVLDRRPRSATSKAPAAPWLRPATPWRSLLYTRRAYARGTRRRALTGTSSRRRNANGVPSARRPSRQESSGRLRGHDHPWAWAYAFLRTLVQTRTKGHSAVGVVCYRFGLAAQSSFLGEDGVPRTFDYTHRTAIAQTGYALPHGASDAWRDPLEWAHRVEAADRRKNSRQCRDDVLGIPIALVEAGTHVAAIQEYAELLAAEHDTPVHFVVHPPDRGGRNWHAHVVYAGRRIDPEDGERFAAKRDRTQDVADRRDTDGNVIEKRGIHHRHRALWTEVCQGHGLALDWTPNETPQIHIGPQACALERRAIVTEASGRMAEAIAGTGEAPPDPQTLRECAELAHGINDGLTVRAMLDLDRDPVHPRAIMCPKTPPPAGQRIGQIPAAPRVAPALRLDTPPGIGHEPDIRLEPPAAPRVAPALRLDTPPGIGHEPGIRLEPPAAPRVAPALRLDTPPGIGHEPGIRLEPPAAPRVAPALRLDTPPHIGHEPGIRLGPPAAPGVRSDAYLPPPHIEREPGIRLGPPAAPEVRSDAYLPPPHIGHEPGTRLGPPAAPGVRSDAFLPPPCIGHEPGIRLGPPAAPGVQPDAYLPPPHIGHEPGIRLGPPAAPEVRSDAYLPPPHIGHEPGTRLGPPPPPLRLSVHLPQPIHLRPEVREIPQRIRAVVRTTLESAGAKRIESRMGSAAGSAGFYASDFGVNHGAGTVRAANQALDEEISTFVPRGENRKTMSAHLEAWRRKLAKAVKRWQAHVRRRHDKIVERIVAAVLPTAHAEAIDRIRQREAQLWSAPRKRTPPKPAPAPPPQRHAQVAPQRSPPTSGGWDPWG